LRDILIIALITPNDFLPNTFEAIQMAQYKLLLFLLSSVVQIPGLKKTKLKTRTSAGRATFHSRGCVGKRYHDSHLIV